MGKAQAQDFVYKLSEKDLNTKMDRIDMLAQKLKDAGISDQYVKQYKDELNLFLNQQKTKLGL